MTTFERIKRKMVDDLRYAPAGVTADMTWADAGIDSLERVELVLNLEAEFGIYLSDDHLEQIESMPKLVETIDRLVAERK